MKTLTSSAVTALGSRVLGLVTLVKLDFPTSAVLLATANFNIVTPSGTYIGANGLGQISPIEDGPGEVKGLSLSLSGVPSEYIAMALDDAAIVQGTPVTISAGIFDGETRTLCDEDVVWSGRLDTMSIEEDGETCTIAATAESTAVDLLRGNAMTYSNADQQAIYPGDRAFEYVVSQSNTPIVWPDRMYFIAKGGG